VEPVDNDHNSFVGYFDNKVVVQQVYKSHHRGNGSHCSSPDCWNTEEMQVAHNEQAKKLRTVFLCVFWENVNSTTAILTTVILPTMLCLLPFCLRRFNYCHFPF